MKYFCDKVYPLVRICRVQQRCLLGCLLHGYDCRTLIVMIYNICHETLSPIDDKMSNYKDPCLQSVKVIDLIKTPEA